MWTTKFLSEYNKGAELQDTIKKFVSTVKNAEKAAVGQIYPALSSFAKYALMKVNSTLGQLTTKKLDEYIKVFELKVKTCEAYERNAAKGKIH